MTISLVEPLCVTRRRSFVLFFLSCVAGWYPWRYPSSYPFSFCFLDLISLVVQPCDLWVFNTWWAVLGPSLLVGAWRLGSAWSCLPCSVAWTLGLLGVPFLSISCSLTWETMLVTPRCFPSWRRGSVWEINLYHWLAKPLWGLWSGFKQLLTFAVRIT